MQLLVLLLKFLLMVLYTDCKKDDKETRGNKFKGTDRENVQIPPPTMKEAKTPLNFKSKGVPKFHDYDSTFYTEYSMKCGSDVRALIGATKGNARCWPQSNDIVYLLEDDRLSVQDCLKIIVCKPGPENQLCRVKSIQLWFPLAGKLVTSSGMSDFGTGILKVKKGHIVFTDDPSCLMTFENRQALQHRYQNKNKMTRAIMETFPGFYLQPVFHNPKKKYMYGNQVSFGGNLHKGGAANPTERKTCGSRCDLGRVIYYRMTANMYFFAKVFVNGGVCEWMKICTFGRRGLHENNFICQDTDLINVYIRNGFVTMPSAKNGAPIRFVKSSVKKRDHTISWKTGPTQIGVEFDGERFAVWSVSREVVFSRKGMNHDGDIIFYLSDHHCLVRKKGIRHMGFENGIVCGYGDKPIGDVSTGTGRYATYPTAPSRKRPPTIGTVYPVLPLARELSERYAGTARTDTEPPTPDRTARAPRTTTPRRYWLGAKQRGGAATVQARTGWLIWMVFVGFLCGSLVALLISCGVLFCARRTAYGVWYRGMYKRYGCDASGITGGITGSLFGVTSTGVGGKPFIGPTTLGDTSAPGSSITAEPSSSSHSRGRGYSSLRQSRGRGYSSSRHSRGHGHDSYSSKRGRGGDFVTL